MVVSLLLRLNIYWENLYIEKPLTFWEFVQKQTNLKKLYFPVENALKTYHRLAQNPLINAPLTEIYATGPTGIGKGVYCNLIIAYKIYLTLLLKEPKKLFDFSKSAHLDCVFICQYKGFAKNFVSFISSIQGENPIFKFNTLSGEGMLIQEDEDNNYYIKYKDNEIVLRSGSSEYDLLGTNPVIVYLNCNGFEL